MSNEREGLRERIAKEFRLHGADVQAEGVFRDKRADPERRADRILSLLTQAQKPVEPIMYAALMEAKEEAATLRKKLDEWIAYADSLASPVASAPDSILRLEGEYTGVRYGEAAILERITAAEVFERLRSAPEPSVPTRTPEHGLSYHDGTEALREALDEGERELRVRLSDDRWVRMLLTDGPSAPQRAIDAIFGPIRRALSQHVGGEG